MDEQEQQQASARTGFTPLTLGRDVYIDRGGGALMLARRDMHVSRGGGQWLIAVGNQTIDKGGGAFLVSREARVSNGTVGVVIANRVSFEGSARALLTISLSTVAAATLGFGLGLLFGRRRAYS